MSKEIIPAQKYFAKKDQLQGRMESLKSEILALENEIEEKTTLYASYVLDDFVRADKLYMEIEDANKTLRAKQARLDATEKISQQELVQYALEVMNSSRNIKDEFKGQLEQVQEQINKAKEDFFKGLKELQILNEKHQNAMGEYSDIWRDLDLDQYTAAERLYFGIPLDSPAASLFSRYQPHILEPLSSHFITKEEYDSYKKSLSAKFVY